jgi:SAM-dependent methyltransferase
MSVREHWDSVYERKGPSEVSWYRPHLERSLGFIETSGVGHDARIIDVGGGASTLVDDLIDRGYRKVTVLDISPRALQSAKVRLGSRAAAVRWLEADVLADALPCDGDAFDFWHDRAVFHFLRSESHRRRYVERVRSSVKVGGYVLIATFGPAGPDRCSGLDVVRYDADQLHAEFGASFQKVGSAIETHSTPGGATQQFAYCCCRVGRP